MISGNWVYRFQIDFKIQTTNQCQAKNWIKSHNKTHWLTVNGKTKLLQSSFIHTLIRIPNTEDLNIAFDDAWSFMYKEAVIDLMEQWRYACLWWYKDLFTLLPFFTLDLVDWWSWVKRKKIGRKTNKYFHFFFIFFLCFALLPRFPLIA